MNWNLDNLTPEQERSVQHYGYVGAFYKVFLPRRLSPAPASPARGQDWPSLLTSILHLRFVLLLLLPQFLFHGSPFFLRILAPAG
ncbi:MAG TPA: hypothetical protein VJY15_14770 [Candidatus Acidoferrum sp.]|nr:hypothetical protein [Candidatus Acidoferrum sp.]